MDNVIDLLRRFIESLLAFLCRGVCANVDVLGALGHHFALDLIDHVVDILQLPTV